MRSWGIFGKEGKSERWKGEKKRRREEKRRGGEEEEWEILGCGLRDFVVVGKVVPLLADCYS